MTPIVLVGSGGHCRACIDVIEATKKFEIAAIVGQQNELGNEILGYSVQHCDSQLEELAALHVNFLITVGQIKTNAVRVKLYETIKKLGGEFPSIISPLAYVSPNASVGEGTIVMHFAMINTGATVGSNCIINTRALVEHDAKIGRHCHVATGAIINGGTSIEDDCFIGSGATIRECIQIQRGSVIGAATWVDGKSNRRTSLSQRHNKSSS